MIIIPHSRLSIKSAIYSLCNAKKGNSILFAGSNGTINEWNYNQQETYNTIAETGERIFCLSGITKNNTLFAGCLSGALFFLDLNNLKLIRHKFHQNSIYRFAIWEDKLIAIAADGIISIWDTLSGQMLDHVKIGNNRLRSLCLDASSSILYVGDSDGTLNCINLSSLNILTKSEQFHQKTIFSLLHYPINNLIISGGLDAHLKISNEGLHVIKDIKAHWFCVNDICDLRGSHFIATASRDKSIRIWDTRDWSLIKEISSVSFTTHIHSVNSLFWDEHENILVSAGDDGFIFSWKLKLDDDTQ